MSTRLVARTLTLPAQAQVMAAMITTPAMDAPRRLRVTEAPVFLSAVTMIHMTDALIIIIVI
jgi:hypothetical protein